MGAIVKTILSIAAVLAALATIFGTLTYFGLAPALSGDVRALDEKQAATAVEVYRNKVRSFIALPEPAAPQQKQILQELVDEARRELKAAEKRKIELSK